MKRKATHAQPVDYQQEAIKGHRGDLTRTPVSGRVKTLPSVNDHIAPAKRLHDGPIWDVSGNVLVDPSTCPTLYRCAQTAGQVIAATRAKWAAVEDAMRHGHYDVAEQLRAPLVGAVPPVRSVSIPADVPADAAGLFEALKKAPDKKAAGRIRAQLRELGIKGGMRALRALGPIMLLVLRCLLD